MALRQSVASACRDLAGAVVARRVRRVPVLTKRLFKAAGASGGELDLDDLQAIQSLKDVCASERRAGFDPAFWIEVIRLVLAILEMLEKGPPAPEPVAEPAPPAGKAA